MLGNQPLEFGNATPEELLSLSESDASREFLSRWMESFDPYRTFKVVFDRLPDSGDRLLHDVKVQYKKLVLEGDWDEDKFVLILNSIMELRSPLNGYTLAKFESLYEQNRLPSQVRRKRNGR